MGGPEGFANMYDGRGCGRGGLVENGLDIRFVFLDKLSVLHFGGIFEYMLVMLPFLDSCSGAEAI